MVGGGGEAAAAAARPLEWRRPLSAGCMLEACGHSAQLQVLQPQRRQWDRWLGPVLVPLLHNR